MNQIVIPKLGQTMEEAVVETWRMKEGDTVAKGDVLLEITTDKATLEVEAFVAGTLRKILAPEGITLPVNTVIALVGDADEPLPDDLAALEAAASSPGASAPAADAPAQEAPATDAPTAAAAPTPTPAAPAAAGTGATLTDGRIFISPRAKRLAEKEKVPHVVLKGTGPNGRIVEKDVQAYVAERKQLKITPAAKVIAAERGVDVLLVTGTGPSGRITKDDVANAPVVTPAAASPAGRRVQLTAMRRVVADRMSQSKREAPHFYLFMDIDMTEVVARRKALNDAGAVRVGFHDILIQACGKAMADHPAMNCAFADGAIQQKGEINIGLAVAIDDGLMVPVVKNVERLALAQTAQATKELIEKARSKRLTPDEYEGGSLTISNLGMYDVDSFLPIINPGESAIMGVGRIAAKPVVIDGGIHVRSIMTVTVSADHRAVDGAIAAAWLKAVKDLLEAPEWVA